MRGRLSPFWLKKGPKTRCVRVGGRWFTGRLNFEESENIKWAREGGRLSIGWQNATENRI